MPETSHLVSSRPHFDKLRLDAARAGGVWLHRGNGGVFHRHAELEINLCIAGHAYYLVSGQRLHLSRRSLLWLFPAQNHVLFDASPDFAMWIAVWKPELIAATADASRELEQQQPGETWFSQLQPEDATRLEALFGQLSQALDDDHFNAGLSYALMEAHHARARSSETIGGRAVHPCVQEAAQILRDESLDVPTLANRVGLSPNRLSRLFRAQIGASITEFRTRMALERFAQIYDGRSLSLTDAAIEAGFGSYAGFHRAFSAHYGYSPARHREKVREG